MGLELHPVTESELLGYMREVIRAGKKALIPTLNIHGANFAHRLPWFREFLNRAHLLYCDGDGIRLGLRLSGIHPPPKIALNSWMWDFAAASAREGWTHFFLGGRPGVPEEAARRLAARYPGFRVVGARDNIFRKEGPENDRVIAGINRAKPDILIVGFGMPLQERWIAANWEKIDAHILMTAGSTFEFVSGRIKTAPPWMIRWHLEWFFRLTQEPRRLFKRYVFGNTDFFLRILRDRMGRQK